MNLNKLPKDASSTSAGVPLPSGKPKALLIGGSIIVTHTLDAESAADNPNGIVNVTRGMVRERAFELAVTNGRQPHEASKSDWEDAKRELLGLPRTFTSG